MKKSITHLILLQNKRIYFYLIFVFVLIVYHLASTKLAEENVHRLINSHLSDYQDIAKSIIDDSTFINEEFIKHNYFPYHNCGEWYWNYSFFNSEILYRRKKLNIINKLWDKKLLNSSPRFNVIKLRSNGSIIFTIESIDYFILGRKYYYLVFNNRESDEGIYPNCYVMKENRIILSSKSINPQIELRSEFVWFLTDFD